MIGLDKAHFYCGNDPLTFIFYLAVYTQDGLAGALIDSWGNGQFAGLAFSLNGQLDGLAGWFILDNPNKSFPTGDLLLIDSQNLITTLQPRLISRLVFDDFAEDGFINRLGHTDNGKSIDEDNYGQNKIHKWPGE